jgi:hypothetical protein
LLLSAPESVAPLDDDDDDDELVDEELDAPLDDDDDDDVEPPVLVGLVELVAGPVPPSELPLHARATAATEAHATTHTTMLFMTAPQLDHRRIERVSLSPSFPGATGDRFDRGCARGVISAANARERDPDASDLQARAADSRSCDRRRAPPCRGGCPSGR